MKFPIYIIYLLLILSAMSCKSKNQKTINDSALQNEVSKEQVSSSRLDTLLNIKNPNPEDIYLINQGLRDNIAKLKNDESTKKDSKSLIIHNTDIEKQLDLIYIDNRIITLEIRYFDSEKNQVELEVFDFDDNNSCICYTNWHKEDLTSYYYTLINNSLIKYDMNNKIIPLDSEQKQLAIRKIESSLDSAMLNFSKFKYEIDWQ